mgnify:CR=1 FL=1
MQETVGTSPGTGHLSERWGEIMDCALVWNRV